MKKYIFLLMIMFFGIASSLFGGTISGNVSEPDNSSDYFVDIFTVMEFDPVWFMYSGTVDTDSTGYYIFNDLMPASYIVCASRYDKRENYEFYQDAAISANATILTVGDYVDTNLTNIDFVLDDNNLLSEGVGSISGIVTDYTDHLQKFMVELYKVEYDQNQNPNYNLVKSLLTEHYGHYSVNNLPDGDYIVRARSIESTNLAEWYNNVRYPEFATVFTIDQDSQRVDNIDFVMGSMDMNNDGIMTGVVTYMGAPVSHAKIEINIPYAYMVEWEYTDENGYFKFDNLFTSYYMLMVEAQGFSDYYYNGEFSYDDADILNFAEDDDDSIHVEIDLFSFSLTNFNISGTVRDSETGEGLAGKEVILEQTGINWGHIVHIFTDNYGNYQGEVTNGDYLAYVEGEMSSSDPQTVLYETQYYDHKKFPDQGDILNISSNMTDIDFDLIPYEQIPYGTIAGNVSPSYKTFRFFVDVFDITASSMNCIPEPLQVARVKRNGDYSVSLPLGSYYLLAKDENGTYYPEFYQDAVSFDDATLVSIENNGDEITGIDFYLENIIPSGYGKVSGYITEGLDEPVARAQIFLDPIEANYTIVMPYNTETDENGFYNIEGVAPGIYKFSVKADGFNQYFYEDADSWETADEITLPENCDLNIDVNLSPYEIEHYLVAGTVRDAETGDPIAGAIVAADHIYHDPNTELIPEGVAITDTNGQWTMETYSGVHIFHSFAYIDSYYMLQFYDHVQSPIHADRVNVNSDIQNIDFDLLKYDPANSYSISGNITDENGNVPVYGVSVVAISSDEDWEESVPMEPDGSYKFNNLKDGYYYILAISAKSAPTYYKRYIDFESATPVPVGSTGIDIQLLSIENIGYCNLTGTVTDELLDPVANTMIYAVDSFGMIRGYTQSDHYGYYSIENLSSGNYELLATKVRYNTDIESRIISGDDSVDFQLGESTLIENDIIPSQITLSQNYPNPFNPVTKIDFSIPNKSNVRLNVYNINGQLVNSLIDFKMEKGFHSINFNAESQNSGVYFYKLNVNGVHQDTKKMLLIK